MINLKNNLLVLTLLLSSSLYSYKKETYSFERQPQKYSKSLNCTSNEKLLQLAGLISLISTLNENQTMCPLMKELIIKEIQELIQKKLTLDEILSFISHHYLNYIYSEDEIELPQPYDFCDL